MSLENFFKPQAVAIIGASSDPAKIGRQILDNIISGGFKGGIYPINLKEKKIAGLAAYPDLNDLPKEKPETILVVIAIPAKFVMAEIEKCAKLGFKNIIIISAGFKESGAEGRALEEQIIKIAQENSLNILGPNCLGFINTLTDLNATFGAAKNQDGNIAILSQSGAVGSAVLDWLKDKDFNLGYFVSLGNKAVLSESDLLEYLATDDKIDLIIFYLEDVKEGQKFMTLASRIIKNKPIAYLHAGESQMGTKMASSHSGALAGSAASFRTGMERAGAIHLNDLRELFNLLLFAPKDWHNTNNKDLYLITNAGGPAVLTADEIGRLDVPFGGSQDILGDANALTYKKALDLTLAKDGVDNLLVLLTPQTSTQIIETAQAIIFAAKKYPAKLIMASFIGGEAVLPGVKLLAENNIPVFEYPEEAIRTYRKIIDYKKTCANLTPYNQPVDSSEEIITQVDYANSFALLNKYSIPIVEVVAYNKKDIKKYKYPAVLKIVGPDFLHKTEKGGVVINLKTPADLYLAADQMIAENLELLKNPANYLVVQEQAFKFQEILLGFKRDNNFGPIIMIGWGGIYTEILKDFKLATSDLTFEGAKEAIKDLKIYQILNGARGQKKYDIEALAKAIVNVARLANDHPEISELDINPLFVEEDGVKAGDVRIIL
ncbi:MAG: acetate--CoA ligase family protein [Patescibacteria group bacterium]